MINLILFGYLKFKYFIKKSIFENCKEIPYPKRECIPEEEPEDKDKNHQQQQQQQHQQQQHQHQHQQQQQQQHQMSLQQPPDKRMRINAPMPNQQPVNVSNGNNNMHPGYLKTPINIINIMNRIKKKNIFLINYYIILGANMSTENQSQYNQHIKMVLNKNIQNNIFIFILNFLFTLAT